ncbi:2OG-Fe(II) oxygenase [Legionella jordanis]|uniref:2OG-Fe(II) oxygenase n=1 Tax=Legionella jordanis TaxID=456 RepID=A0A0W0VEV5_9GAMM|nr:2OG-Fe(II) oxygenase [Legionella jordanis]KTD18647.1 2OG-Fe(II) oxygenase [Legionella jordanis]RMX00843.1 SM-20-like protein [Legionella jordanis]VEH11523.1 2OG-Fe(II) oxygenase [Legionella jordanis]HAT8715132.1 SM-20-like protein [Legionella jordanis]
MKETIIDHICAKGFHVIDHFLPVKDFKHLREKADGLQQDGQFRRAKIGRQLSSMLHNDIRTDEINWLDEHIEDKAVQPFLARISEIAAMLNQALFLGLVEFEAHFAVYQPGSFYKKHIDQFATTQDRQISCVYYLNHCWHEQDGGELKLYNHEGELLFNTAPLPNRFICFRSDLPHEVCVTKNSRYSIAGWLKRRSEAI